MVDIKSSPSQEYLRLSTRALGLGLLNITAGLDKPVHPGCLGCLRLAGPHGEVVGGRLEQVECVQPEEQWDTAHESPELRLRDRNGCTV